VKLNAAAGAAAGKLVELVANIDGGGVVCRSDGTGACATDNETDGMPVTFIASVPSGYAVDWSGCSMCATLGTDGRTCTGTFSGSAPTCTVAATPNPACSSGGMPDGGMSDADTNPACTAMHTLDLSPASASFQVTVSDAHGATTSSFTCTGTAGMGTPDSPEGCVVNVPDGGSYTIQTLSNADGSTAVWAPSPSCEFTNPSGIAQNCPQSNGTVSCNNVTKSSACAATLTYATDTPYTPPSPTTIGSTTNIQITLPAKTLTTDPYAGVASVIDQMRYDANGGSTVASNGPAQSVSVIVMDNQRNLMIDSTNFLLANAASIQTMAVPVGGARM
jgi:hypothetical protein